VPKRAVVVTLDDGYADNLHAAKPALEANGVPATVFVTSGLLGRQSWWDELALLMSSEPRSAEQGSIELDGRVLQWNLRATNRDPGARADCIRSFQRALLDSSPEARDRAMGELREAFRGTGPHPTSPRMLTPEELMQLASGPAIEVGAHSVSHPRLGALSQLEQRLEISRSKESLEALLSTPVRAFSYPNGSFSSTTGALVREAGYACACASFSGVASASSDPFALPRMWIGDGEVGAFARRIRRWL
jgi:peptidoglycan/xylan/chitin deacetylase (PgdA/CDA1 family)